MNTNQTPSQKTRAKGQRFCALKALCVFVLAFLSFSRLADAQWFKRFNRPSNPIPIVFNGPPTQPQLLQRLAAQTASVNQVDASVSVELQGAPKLKGTLQIERPLRLRLKAGVLGVDQMGVDVGSNDQLFWIWTRVPIPGQPPTLMYAAHEQFKRSSGAVRQAIPLEPSWLINALGLVEFSNDDFHQGPLPTREGRLKLITVSDAAAGRQYRITIIDATRGLIEQQSIYDENRRLIAYTNSTGYKFYPEHNVSLPNKIEMHLFSPDGTEQSLTVKTTGFNINSLFGDPQRMWTMPQPANVQRIDLSQVGGQANPPPTPRRPALPPPQPTLSPPRPSYRGATATPVSDAHYAAPSTGRNNGRHRGQYAPATLRPTPSSAPVLSAPQPRTRLSPLK